MTAMQKLTLPADRIERLHYIKRMFPDAPGPDLAAEWAGGRASGLSKLHALDAKSYARNRNFLNGAVTHLSPYIRYGCLPLPEVFAVVKSKFGMVGENLLMQLAWRDFWHQVWQAHGDEIFSEMEPPKVGIAYQPLPESVKQGKTGLPCMDAFIHELNTTGYMHNHARMWLASYLIHFLKIDWRESADWFESQLLDGDFACNHLSWQWVASTFSSKPYYFNKENLSRFTGEKYCDGCKAKCPFDDSYENLSQRLFTAPPAESCRQYPINPLPMRPVEGQHQALAVYVHDAMLSPVNPVLNQPFPKIFVFDAQRYARWPLARLQFVADCLAEMMSIEVWRGDTYAVLMHRQVGKVITQETADSDIKNMLHPLPVSWQPRPKLTSMELSAKRLRRFSRYWEKVGPTLLGNSPDAV